MKGSVLERGEIRLRTLLEIVFVFVFAYLVFQIGPAVKLRIDFLNAMEVAANSPIDKTADQIKMDLRTTAESIGITVHSERLFVERDVNAGRTIITAHYEIHISLSPAHTYVWNVKDQVEAYLF